MAKYELRLPSGTILTALKDLSVTWQINDAKDVSPGSACAAMLEAAVFGDAPLESGDRVDCYEAGVLLGTFYCRSPKRRGNLLTLTAYDAMIRFDRDITPWLAAQTFPMTAQALLEGLCAHCEVPLEADTALPEFSVEAFSRPGLTGRQLLQYLGQLGAGLWQITPAGQLRLFWYDWESPAVPAFAADSLTCAEAPAAPIERVLIRTASHEVGAVWPDGSQESANTYILQGNPLLPTSADRQAVAKYLYGRLKDYRCTAFTGTLLPGQSISCGAVAQLPNGCAAPVMKLTLRNGRRTAEATAGDRLQSTESFNRLQLEDLPGRVLTVERTADGLKAENTGIRGDAAALALTVEGITARVSSAEERSGEYALKSQLSVLEQQAQGLSLSVTRLQTLTDTKADESSLAQVTEHFRFGSDGLTITDSATGMGIRVSEEAVAFHGGASSTTVITPNAMETTNLDVATRLGVGGFTWLPRSNGNLSLRYTAK